MSESRLFFAGSVALIVAGLLVPYWPLGALGVVLAAAAGHYLVAAGAGIALDLLWGAPPGLFEALMFPFALLALMSTGLRLYAKRYFFQKSTPMRLY